MKAINIEKTLAFPESPSAGKLYLVKEDNHVNLLFRGSEDPKPVKARRGVLLKGETSMPRSYASYPAKKNLTIENYDSFTSYVKSISAGSLTGEGELITVTTPVAGEKIYLTVNGEISVINLRNPTINKPSITYPLNNGTNTPLSFSALISNYDPEALGEPYERTEWQLASDAAFTNILKSDTITGVSAPSSIAIFGLSSNSVYYMRFRYKGTLSGYSAWSDGVKFTTKFSEVSGAEQAKLTAPDGAADDRFGQNVVISGDGNTIAIGAYYDDTTQVDGGSVYIYVRNGASWTYQAKLVPNDPIASGLFGMRVCISANGNVVAIGSVGANPNGATSGAVYIFRRNTSNNTWAQEQKVYPNDGASGDQFGFSVSLSRDGSTFVSGSYFNDTQGNNAGCAYVFTYTAGSWIQKAKLIGPDTVAGDYFGHVVIISADGQTIAIDAVYDTDRGTNAGSVYIYVLSNNTWVYQAKLLGSDTTTGDLFGRYLALSGDGNILLAGASEKTGVSAGSGAAYIFKRNGTSWSQQAKIVPADNAGNDNFGFAVALSYDGKFAAIGARYSDYKGLDSGCVYLYTTNGTNWTQKLKFSSVDTAASDLFGTSLSLTEAGDTLVVGAFGDDDKGSNSGSAYVFI